MFVLKKPKTQPVKIVIIIIHDVSGAIKVFLPFNMTPFRKIHPKEIKQKFINDYMHKKCSCSVI